MKYRISTADKFLITVIAVVSLAAPVVMNYSSANARTAQVSERGSVIKEIDLATDAVTTLKLRQGFIVLQVLQGKIRVRTSSCPEKVCVGMGWISKTGQSIVCVPNKVLIEVRGLANANYDALTY
jgi:hypothetical protein